MSYLYTSLAESEVSVTEFMAKFKEISLSRGGDGDAFDLIINAKLELIHSGKITGFVMWDGPQAVGIAWVEKTTPSYGSILVYATEGADASALVNYFIDSKSALGVMSELLQFESDQSIYELFRARGVLEIPRQRMVCHLPETSEYPEIPEGYTLLPLSQKTALQVAQISVPAHQLSGDYRGYRDMESVDGRLKLETLVHSQFYGPVSRPASLGLVSSTGELQSIILNVLVPCWGEPQMPWIYDIATEIDSMGNGLGEWLLKYAKAVLVDCRYSMWGLAVSLCNTGAIAVYERNNFIVVDTFSEFLQQE